MASITNLRLRELKLPTGHIVPAASYKQEKNGESSLKGGLLQTDNSVLRCFDLQVIIPSLVAAGEITVEYDPDPEPDAPEAATSIEVHPAADNSAKPNDKLKE